MKDFLKLNMFEKNKHIWINKRKKVVAYPILFKRWTIRQGNKIVFRGAEDKAITYLLSSGICIFI